MIIRSIGARNGRQQALAVPWRSCFRAVHMEYTRNATAADFFGQDSLPPSTAPDESATVSKSVKTPSIFHSVAKPARRPKAKAPDTTMVDWQAAEKFRRQNRGMGAKVARIYKPNDVFHNPPGPKDVTLELLMASQVHMGHNTSLWNPANARYIYGIREGIHIISLEQTAAHLRRAARVVEEIAYRAGLILFVGTRPGHTQIVTMAARLAQSCHLFTKWTPGSITNSMKILPGLPLKILDENDKPVVGVYDRYLLDKRPLLPDLIVCLNPLENFVLLKECSQANIPSIGVIDTNVEPTWVTYAIPANDDSLRGLAVIGAVLGRAGEEGRRRRLEDAKSGQVAWQTPLDMVEFLAAERRKKGPRTEVSA